MKKQSWKMTLLGVLAAILAALMLAFSGLMLLLKTPVLTCAVTAITAAFPAVLAVALLVPRYRSPAIRAVGAIMCIALLGALISSFVNPPQGGVPAGRQRGVFGLLIVASGYMAWKGKWPGDDDDDAPPQHAKYSSH